MLRQFEPDLILVSAGFDAHERDPLGGMRLSTAGVRGDDAGTARPWPRSAAADGIVSVTEGGYDLQALAASLDAIIDAHAAAVVIGAGVVAVVRQNCRARIAPPSRRYDRRTRPTGSSKPGSC